MEWRAVISLLIGPAGAFADALLLAKCQSSHLTVTQGEGWNTDGTLHPEQAGLSHRSVIFVCKRWHRTRSQVRRTPRSVNWWPFQRVTEATRHKNASSFVDWPLSSTSHSILVFLWQANIALSLCRGFFKIDGQVSGRHVNLWLAGELSCDANGVFIENCAVWNNGLRTHHNEVTVKFTMTDASLNNQMLYFFIFYWMEVLHNNIVVFWFITIVDWARSYDHHMLNKKDHFQSDLHSAHVNYFI